MLIFKPFPLLNIFYLFKYLQIQTNISANTKNQLVSVITQENIALQVRGLPGQQIVFPFGVRIRNSLNLFAFVLSDAGNQCSRAPSETSVKCKGFYTKHNRFHPLTHTVFQPCSVRCLSSSVLAKGWSCVMQRKRDKGQQFLHIGDDKLFWG